MTYLLEFKPTALKEWSKLDNSVKSAFKKKLKEILENPKIESNRLSGLPNCYKIKLRSAGYRLVYQVNDDRIVVLILAIGKRERSEAYEKAMQRL
ncbi:type II toxin-antitoxin system RelE family toxin [Parasutterella secunda]|uniref:Type II toxin-antitoxin system RelE/ParE family toxin n=1 Tax=Parasutterella secunda TaxID=626947 RepID=A0ABS2GSF9_9BURK|nr:type II toxin-antitoxin system RelE/ParE family toxin [Parasutterella secunda]MBM6928783.1 type II toxin-antitoxin system RelE/ParE family toxin [Parasutterella secunda]